MTNISIYKEIFGSNHYILRFFFCEEGILITSFIIALILYNFKRIRIRVEVEIWRFKTHLRIQERMGLKKKKTLSNVLYGKGVSYINELVELVDTYCDGFANFVLKDGKKEFRYSIVINSDAIYIMHGVNMIFVGYLSDFDFMSKNIRDCKIEKDQINEFLKFKKLMKKSGGEFNISPMAYVTGQGLA